MKEPMMSVKQVCEITGLTRKLLFDYKNVVKPSGHSNLFPDGRDGYKLYNSEAVTKLQHIAIYRELGLSRKEIIDKLTSSNYDSNKIIEEQLQLLHEKKKKLDSHIAAVEQLRLIGIKNNVLRIFKGTSLQQFGDSLLEVKQNQKDYIEALPDILFSLPWNEFIDEIEPLINSFSEIPENELDSQKTVELLDSMFAIIRNRLGFIGVITIFYIIICLLGEGEIVEAIKDLGLFISVSGAQSILNYLYQNHLEFENELEKVFRNHSEVFFLDFSDERVLLMVEDAKEILLNYYGIKSSNDYKILFDMVKEESFDSATPSRRRYFLAVMNHYALQI